MDLVRMTKGPRVRNVRAKVVNKMRQNGWQVDEPPKKRRRSSPETNEPPEDTSAGSSLPENEEEK